MEDVVRVAELEAKLEILQVRFDKLREEVKDARNRIGSGMDEWSVQEVRRNLAAALKI